MIINSYILSFLIARMRYKYCITMYYVEAGGSPA